MVEDFSIKKVDSAKDTQHAAESIESEKEKWEEKYEQIAHILVDTLFRSNGMVAAGSGEKGFSGDAASLFVLVSMKTTAGEDVPKLVKAGWGEFSLKAFDKSAEPRYPDAGHQAIKKFPYDLYCVRQSDSYFANEQQQKGIKEDPIEYLSKNTMIVANSGAATMSERVSREKGSEFHLPKESIRPIPYDEMVSTVRNEIIDFYSTPEEVAEFLQELPDDQEDLRDHLGGLKNRESQLMSMFFKKGTSEEVKSILEMKNKFDFETKSFIP